MEIISNVQSEYSDILIAVKAIKRAIIDSRYQLAKIVNKEVITLYYNVGKYISERSRVGHWGTGAIKTLSMLLQLELPGLRGFSETPSFRPTTTTFPTPVMSMWTICTTNNRLTDSK